MEVLNKYYIFAKDKYLIKPIENSFFLISNELFEVLCVNETGIEIINELDGTKTVNDIISKLSGDYGIEEDIISELVVQFVIKLVKSDLITDVLSEYSSNTINKQDRLRRFYVSIAGREGEELNPDIIADILEMVQTDNDKILIYVHGKEPMLHSRFDEVLQILSKTKQNNIIVCTDGNILRHGWKTAIQEYVNGIMLKFAHTDREINDQVLGKGHYDHYKEALQFYRDCRVPVYMNVIPTEKNIDSLTDIQQYAYDLHMNGIQFQTSCFPGSVKPQDGLVKDYEGQYKQVKKELYKLSNFLNAWRNNRSKSAGREFPLFFEDDRCFSGFRALSCMSHCGLMLNEISVDLQGRIYPCHKLHCDEFMFKNADEYLANKDRFKKERVTNNKCNECDFWLICMGGCRADTYHHRGEMSALSSACEEQKLKIMERLTMIAKR